VTKFSGCLPVKVFFTTETRSKRSFEIEFVVAQIVKISLETKPVVMEGQPSDFSVFSVAPW
jgi:hypothetical protein